MLKFYRCNTCGNLIEIIDESGVIPICCGQPMNLLRPGISDDGMEKHLPVCAEISQLAMNCKEPSEHPYTITVKVGETAHPMSEEHYIRWILVHTDQGIYRKHLLPNQLPEAEFLLNPDEKVIAIYSYCNRHGLWVKNYQ